ncbi:MAG: hypothetical protein ACRC4M_05135 [Mycoplasma sp.]
MSYRLVKTFSILEIKAAHNIIDFIKSHVGREISLIEVIENKENPIYIFKSDDYKKYKLAIEWEKDEIDETRSVKCYLLGCIDI